MELPWSKMTFWIRFHEGNFDKSILIRFQQGKIDDGKTAYTGSWKVDGPGKDWINLLALEDHGYYLLHPMTDGKMEFSCYSPDGKLYYFSLANVPAFPNGTITPEEDCTVYIENSRNATGKAMARSGNVRWRFAGMV